MDKLCDGRRGCGEMGVLAFRLCDGSGRDLQAGDRKIMLNITVEMMLPTMEPGMMQNLQSIHLTLLLNGNSNDPKRIKRINMEGKQI